NPVKWFSESHPIRVADTELNKHFGGTYMAYLVLEEDTTTGGDLISKLEPVKNRLDAMVQENKADVPKLPDIAVQAKEMLVVDPAKDTAMEGLLDRLAKQANHKMDTSEDRDIGDAWFEIANFFELEKERLRPFKQPEVLEYIDKLETYLIKTDVVGKSNSIAGIVKKVHQELIDGKPDNYRLPESMEMVAECLIQYQSSHRPQDLWHFVRQDYSAANLWIQLTSGDNKDMETVVKAVEEFFLNNPPPVPLEHHWAGLTYINIIWQNKMVWGMLQSFLGSFLIVFIMMTILFRSPLWGILCMVPLTITIVMIYGVIGLIGKDYDMPVAVLSALTLGMAVDFAIHFLERARAMYAQGGSWEKIAGEMFGEPARAITRNVLVIAIGFLPLLAAPLVPYKTVGIFLCAIMALSGTVTLLALPALLRLGEKWLFKPAKVPISMGCNCGFCLVISMASVILIALNLHQYWHLGATKLLLVSAVVIPFMAIVCGQLSRRRACRRNGSQVGDSKERIGS
ncbi:MAG: MMPL family transporter, partial [Sedimentisphaerales bacterium]|nr:MMPL family transporter [Sedimentisphaerales bacterium]